MGTDYQIKYNEVLAKFEEAKKYYNEIVNKTNELRQINEAIIEVCNINVYKTKQYLDYRYSTLNNEKNYKIRECNDKLNEALSKAFDIADDETNNGIFPQNSSGVKVATVILLYIGINNIEWQCSVDVKMKLSKLVNKGANFTEIQRQYNCLWQSIWNNGNSYFYR